MSVRISKGFSDAERPIVAALFWQAFRLKLGIVLGPDKKALKFFESIVSPEFALTARSADGQLLGLAGFKTQAGTFSGGTFSDLRNVYGWFGALWRGALVEVLERKLQPGVFQMDGIFVEESARGQGIGSRLLTAIAEHAIAQGASEVQLDVIDINPRARALYERVGFRPIGTEETGPFRYVFGFRSSTRMSLAISPKEGSVEGPGYTP
ncbi:MAG: GNAT family N-acetyltransferase [Pseudomonadota bacterium]